MKVSDTIKRKITEAIKVEIPKTDIIKSVYPNVDMSGILNAVITNTGKITRITARDEMNLQKYGKTEGALAKEREVTRKITEAKDIREKAEALVEMKQAEQKAKERIKEARNTPQFTFYTASKQEPTDKDRKSIIMIGSVVFLFCLMTVGGIILASTIISKQVASTATNTAEQLVASINKTIERPIGAVGGGDISDMADKAMNPTTGSDVGVSPSTAIGVPPGAMTAHMKAISQYPEAVKKAAGVSWDEILAFDAMVKSVSESTNNPIIKEIFSESVVAPINYIAEGYRIWAYIMTVREKTPIDPGIALLEAASLVKYTSEYGVPLALAVGVTQTESTFRTEAISNKKACGPMQVVYDVHHGLLREIGITRKEDLFTADKGIQGGCYLLGRYLKEEKSITSGLKRYYGALSAKYINTVVSNRHTYELFSSGVDRNVAMMATKEELNWSKLNAAKAPVIKASSNTSPSISTKTTTRTAPSTVAQPPAAMTIYKNTGTISIKKPDGTVIVKRMEEDI